MTIKDTDHSGPVNIVELNPVVEILRTSDNDPSKLVCQCKRCDHQWIAAASKISAGKGCPKCDRISGTSFMEQFVCVALEIVLGRGRVKSRDRSAIGMELDVLVPPGFAIEMGSWRWHKDRVYGRDKEKRDRCRKKGIRLITIYDNVPEDAVVPSECRRYPFDLASEENHAVLKDLVIEILAEFSVDWAERLSDWSYIERMAAIRASCRGHERFVAEMKVKNPTIIIESQYTRGYTKVSCRCGVCGYTWRAIPDSLLKGIGCPGCGWKASAAAKRKTHEQFVADLRELNPTIEVKGSYANAVTKIECLCKVCGCNWMVVPDSLLQGTGCPDCGKRKNHDNLRKTHEQFLFELAEVNPSVEILDEYLNARAKIECLCKTCGHRWPSVPERLLHGMGCPECGKKKRANSRRKSHEQFVLDLERVHPTIEAAGRYEGKAVKIPCRCKTCGHAWYARPDNLLSGKGCPACKTRNFVNRMAEKRKTATKS